MKSMASLNPFGKEAKVPRIMVFASGEEGSENGLLKLYEATCTNPPALSAKICALVTSRMHCPAAIDAKALGIPLLFWEGPYDDDGYRQLFQRFSADFAMLSGWLLPVNGLPPERTISIYRGPLPYFRGKGFYGKNLHTEVIDAYKRGEIRQTAMTMHFVTDAGQNGEDYGKGPVIFQYPILIRKEDTPKSLAVRIGEVEGTWQAYILNLVVHGQISLKGNEVHHNCPHLAQFMPGKFISSRFKMEEFPIAV